MADNKTLSVIIDGDLLDNLEWYCEMTNTEPEAAVRDIIKQGISPYVADGDGPRKAVYTPQALPGYEHPKPKEVWILGETRIFGAKYYRFGAGYYRAVLDGRLAKIPADYVEFCEED